MSKKAIIITIVCALLIGIISFVTVRFGLVEKLTKPKVQVDNKVEQQEMDQYYVLTDNLKLRQEPDVASSELKVLKIGEVVGFIKKSDTKVNLYGYENYWYNVKVEDATGWVFGEYVGNAKELDTKLPQRFDAFIKDLAIKDISNVSKVVNVYKEYTDLNQNTAVNDAMFRKFMNFYTNVYSNLPFSTGELESIKDDPAKTTNLRQNGFRLIFAEGNPEIAQDYGFIYLSFYDTVSDGIKDYIITKKGQMLEVPLFEDAGLAISRDKLSDWVIDWEKYIKKYSNYPEAKEAKDLINLYLTAYLVDIQGLDNARLFINDILAPDAKLSYERFVNNYSDSQYYEIVKGYYDILKKNDFKNVEEARTFLKNKGVNVD